LIAFIFNWLIDEPVLINLNYGVIQKVLSDLFGFCHSKSLHFLPMFLPSFFLFSYFLISIDDFNSEGCNDANEYQAYYGTGMFISEIH
jgi:hypothetical protein